MCATEPDLSALGNIGLILFDLALATERCERRPDDRYAEGQRSGLTSAAFYATSINHEQLPDVAKRHRESLRDVEGYKLWDWPTQVPERS